MTQFIDVEIIVPSLRTAVEQIAMLSLASFGVDITRLPFWCAVIGFPLAVFDTFTKHIATALNLLLYKLHRAVKHTISMFIPVVIFSTIFIFFMFVGYENGKIPRQVTSEELSVFFYYAILVVIACVSLLFVISLSHLTGLGNYVAGIGFILGAISIALEIVQEYGFQGLIVTSVVFSATVCLWGYGWRYNAKLAKTNHSKSGKLSAKQHS